MVDRIVSPCVARCAIDADGLCAGCARTIDEIMRWGSMTPADRERVMVALPDRRPDGPRAAG